MAGSLNRRTLFGVMAAGATAAALPVAAGADPSAGQRELLLWAIEQYGALAEPVAQQVIRAGYGMNDVSFIMMTGIRPGETPKVVIYLCDGRSYDEVGPRRMPTAAEHAARREKKERSR